MAGFMAIGLVVAGAPPAAASCAPPLPIADAVSNSDLVVVGTVTAARSGDRIAGVAVEDIWKGEADSHIEVAGGPDQPGTITSVDRTYVVGTRYLFFIREPARRGGSGTFDAKYEDNECTNTRPYTLALDRLRPTSARRIATTTSTTTTTTRSNLATPPIVRTGHDGNAILWLLGSGVLAMCAALIALVARSRHRRRTAAP